MTPKLIDLLREDEVDDAFGSVVLDPSKKEKDTEFETEMKKWLSVWVLGSVDKASSFFVQHKDLFQKAKKKFPNVFNPRRSNGSVVYRGMRGDISSYKLTQKDFVKCETGLLQNPAPNVQFCISTKPVNYKPHNEAQSWTYNIKKANKFRYITNAGIIYPDTFILKTTQDDDFFFNTKFLQTTGWGYKEDEVIHIGKGYSQPVYLICTDLFVSRLPK